MKDVRVFKSLDKKNSFLGLKGLYIKIMVAATVICLGIALFTMPFIGDFYGWMVFGVLELIAWLIVMKYQGKYTERELLRLLSSRNCPDVIRVEPRSLNAQKKERETIEK